jgi:arginine decarboxylase
MEGLVANYAEIRKTLKDTLLIVDEAHGAHCYFSTEMPESALKGGADIQISSVHKTLGAITASALINVSKNSRIPASKVKDAYHLLNTTSPSPLLLADVEGCVRTFRKEGQQLLDHAISLNKKFRDAIARLPQVELADFSASFAADPTKTVFKIRGLTGFEIADHLDKVRINLEKATQRCCVVHVHSSITESDVDTLIEAVQHLAEEYGRTEKVQEDFQELNPLYKKILTQRKYKTDLREVLASEVEVIPVGECLGKISAEIRYICPPGFPIQVYGEEIQQEHIELLGPNFLIKVMKSA